MISKDALDKLLAEARERLNAIEVLLTDRASPVSGKAGQGEALEALLIEYLGRKGKFNVLLKTLPNIDPAQRKIVGAHANIVKGQLEQLLQPKTKESSVSNLDLTLPISLAPHGHAHPVQHTIHQLYTVFSPLGFTPFFTPEIDTEEHNFDSLRVPADHPARDMQDTFWTVNKQVLRTHTTAFQLRALQQLKPPFAVMQGGKIYRAEAEDATHLSEFHQFDGFAVAKGLAFADLKGILLKAMQQLFGKEIEMRFRPSFFPFVEPGAELDIRCPHCKGKGCKSCGYKGWLEMFGCGMTHPEILEQAWLDPNVYQGIAFGMGIERLTMLKYQIDDIREFVKNDPRFLEQIT